MLKTPASKPSRCSKYDTQPSLLETTTTKVVEPHQVPQILVRGSTVSEIKQATEERNVLNDLNGKEWIQETKTVWRQKGLGANHEHTSIERMHPAPYSFQDIARLIRFFTKKGMLVMDPFVGVGSTLKAAALEGRLGLGIELSSQWATLAAQRLDKEVPGHQGQEVWNIDIRDALQKIPDEFVDFVVTSPPYWNILNKKPDHKVKRERLDNGLATNYSVDPRDLGNISDYGDFVQELASILSAIGKKVKLSRYLAVVVSDFKHRERFYPLHSDLYSQVNPSILKLQGITILEQTHKSLYPYGYPFAYVPNIHHQYILLFRRPSLSNETVQVIK